MLELPGLLARARDTEHPDLVAERIVRFARIVGRENVIAGTDCGFATFAASQNVDRAIVWAKLGALAQGARRARAHLQPRIGSTATGYADGMATTRQREAAKRNVKKAQAGAKKKQTLKNLPSSTRTALGKEASAVRKGESPTRKELEAEARRLDIKGRSKMGKDELKRAVARAK
jgi:hypothetical protein